MRYILLLLTAVCLQAQEVIPLTPVLRDRGHLGFAAYWQHPTNGVWIAEWSTNATTWTRCSGETGFPDGSRYTETGTSWTGQYFVRLRRIR